MKTKALHWSVCGAGILALLYVCHPVIASLGSHWQRDPEMAHGPLVPFVIAGLLWRSRERLTAIEPIPSALGIPLLAAGLAGFLASLFGAGLFIATICLLASISGAILLTLGHELLAAMRGPIFLSAFLLPRLTSIYDPVTNPLAQISTYLSAVLLGFAGLEVQATGNLISVGGHPILLGETCSGLRLLIPLLFVAAVLCQMLQLPRRAAALLVIAAVPLAVFANTLRVAVLVFLASSRNGHPPDTVHNWIGYPLFGLALFLLLVLAKQTSRGLTEEVAA